MAVKWYKTLVNKKGTGSIMYYTYDELHKIQAESLHWTNDNPKHKNGTNRESTNEQKNLITKIVKKSLNSLIK